MYLKSSFKEIFEQYSFEKIRDTIYDKTDKDVQNALSKKNLNLEDFKALISPAAEPYLEQMAILSHQITQRRFGKIIQMYIPLYLSNECQNICTYCGFSMNVDMKRKTLDKQDILNEIQAIKKLGYNHILLVTGEANKTVGIEYLKEVIRLIKPYFANISIEVQPLKQRDYEELIQYGLNTVLVYQETYYKQEYKKYHPKGRKSNFDYRLETHDRLGRAGIHKMGLGVLIGLEDWRVDSFFCALHLDYLEHKYWQTKYTISFPRLRPCAGGIPIKSVMTDKQLVQLICAYRIFNNQVELSLSTRETPKFRDNIIPLGITSTSAGSKTNPGGYTNIEQESLEQFEISDNRPTSQFIKSIKQKGYEVVWKDWDSILQ